MKEFDQLAKKNLFSVIQVDKVETDTPGFVFIHEMLFI